VRGPAAARGVGFRAVRALSSTWAPRLFGAASGIALGAATARLFGPAARGAVELLIVLRLGVHAFASLGVQTAATYAVAREPATFRPAASSALGLGLALGAGAGLLLCGAAVAFPSITAPLPLVAACLFFAASPAILATLLESGVLLGAGRVRAWNLLTVVNRGLLVIALGLAFLPPLRSLWTIVLGLVIAEVATFCYVLWTLRREGALSAHVDRPLVARLARYGRAAWIQGILAFALLRLDQVMLTAGRGPHEAGLYAAGGLAREFVLWLPWVAGMLFLPNVAGARAGDRPKAMGPVSITIVLTASTLLFVFAREFVTAVHGLDFLDAAGPARVLVVSALLASVANLCLQYLLGRGAPAVVWIAPAAALLVSVVGNLLVIPGHGAIGVAFVSVASQAVLLAIAGLAAARLSRVPLTPAATAEASEAAPPP
jgi:O-antigen/teichoic acid export membrane protein